MYVHHIAKIDKPDGLVELTGPCTGPRDHAYSVTVKRTELDAYLGGALAQDAFPNLPPAQREFLMSGICPACWEELFSGLDEDDD